MRYRYAIIDNEVRNTKAVRYGLFGSVTGSTVAKNARIHMQVRMMMPHHEMSPDLRKSPHP
jgi:hypothetical protein